jgi:uncharacterized protein
MRAFMTLFEKIENDMRNAMKEGNGIVRDTLRMVKAELLNEKTKTGKDLTEELSLEVVTRCAKKRKEAIAEFNKAGREDLSAKEKEELAVIETYLPKQLTPEEILAAVDAKIASMGSVSAKDMGRLMGDVMKELKGRADGNDVKKAVALRLEGK